MMTKRQTLRCVLPLALLLVASVPPAAQAGEGCTENYSDMAATVKANGLTPAKDIQKQAQGKIDGKIVKVSLCQNAGAFHYELVYLNGNGQVMTQALDAKTPFPQ